MVDDLVAMATATKTSKKAKKASKTSSKQVTGKQPAGGNKANAKQAAARKKTASKPAAGKAANKKSAGAAKGKASASKITEPERSSPAMAEVDGEVLEFIQAIDDFKKANGRPFPSWSEVLLIVKQLGYKRS